MKRLVLALVIIAAVAAGVHSITVAGTHAIERAQQRAAELGE